MRTVCVCVWVCSRGGGIAPRFGHMWSHLHTVPDLRYGRLLGVLCVYGTLVGLAQGSLTDMALETDHGNYKWATVVQLGLMVPLYAWVALVAKRELSVKGEEDRSAVAEQRQHSIDIHTRAPSLQERFHSTGPRSSRSSAQQYLLD